MNAHTRLRSALVLVALLVAVYAVAALGGLATASSVKTWYPELTKPAWNPPAWLFGPVWTLLYAAMAVVAWRVWRRPEGAAVVPGAEAGPTGRAGTLARWWVQLALNGAWSWAFFWFRSPAAGLAVMGALFVVVVSIQPRLARTDRLAALLWTPYVLWLAFAAALNLWIWHHN